MGPTTLSVTTLSGTTLSIMALSINDTQPECRISFIVMLNVIMLSVNILNVIMLSVTFHLLLF